MALPDSLAIAASGAACGVGLCLAGLVAREAFRNHLAVLLCALLLSLVSLELSTGPLALDLIRQIKFGLIVAGSFNLALFWLFVRALLMDRLWPGLSGWAVAAVLWAGPAVTIAGWPREFIAESGAGWLMVPLIGLLTYIAFAHLSWLALSGRAHDLVRLRRSARLWVPPVLIGLAVVSVLSEEMAAPQGMLLRSIGPELGGMMLVAFWLVRVNLNSIRLAPASLPNPPCLPVDPRDADLLARLDLAMNEDQVWREEGLSIDRLAAMLAAPPHVLRQVINKQLGFRNFADFVSRYRIAFAADKLTDPKRARETILVIAYESGFASLATFNRSFRTVHAMTPSQWRAAAWARKAEDTEQIAQHFSKMQR